MASSEKAETDSGLPVAPLYGPEDVRPDPAGEPERPGRFPFTRGIHGTMYRGRLWTMRQYAGFGTAEETNRRYRYLLSQGQSGLSVAFDLPTQMGLDSDAPLAAGEVGRAGVAIDSLEDIRSLFRGIPLDRVSTSMTINSTAPVLLALYVALADEVGVPRGELTGTVQNDILKEYVARGTYVYPVGASLRLVTDVMRFCARELPRWNAISISGYHMREAGATAPQEVAFTFANALEYVDRAVAAGLDLADFGPRLSFFFAAHGDLFEEVAKFRAARRLWARLMRERHDAPDAACRLRFHTQTGGSTLTAQQPLNNVARVTIQALAAVLGGTQSLHTNGYDEAIALPSEGAARVALRTQQILAYEAGVSRTADPLAGSYFVEALTDEIEGRAREHLEHIDGIGGAAKAIDYMRDEIHRSAYRFQMEIEKGSRTIVGVNAFQDEDGPAEAQTSPGAPDYAELESVQIGRLERHRASRDGRAVDESLARIRTTAASTDNLVPEMIRAVKAGVTVGEISDALRQLWGTRDATPE